MGDFHGRLGGFVFLWGYYKKKIWVWGVWGVGGWGVGVKKLQKIFFKWVFLIIERRWRVKREN